MHWLDETRWTEARLVSIIAQQTGTRRVVMFAWMNRESLAHLDYWLYYLNNLASKTQISDVLKKDELLQEAFDVAEFIALGKDEKFSYQQDVKARWDNKSCLDFANISSSIMQITIVTTY